MKINVTSVLQQDAERKAKPKPVPVVKVRHATLPEKSNGVEMNVAIMDEATDVPKLSHGVYETVDECLINSIESERTKILKERAVLSSGIASMVEEIYNRLKAESPGVAEEFMKGNVPMPELAERYAQIEALTEQGAVLYDKLEYVKKYGKLPEEEKKELLHAESADASSLKYQIRRLDDFICKKKANIEKKTPKNPSRVALWKEQLARAEAQRDDMKHKLKVIQDGTRK